MAMEDKQSPTQVAAAVLARLEPILKNEQPDWVLVRGGNYCYSPQNWGPGGWAEKPTLITRNPRPIELHVKRARKSLGRRATADELKAANVEMTVTYTKSLKAG